MHHVIVTRVSVVSCLLLAGAILLFAWLAGDTAVAPDRAGAMSRGEALFVAECARCHEPGELVSELDAVPDRAARLDDWRAFLREHGRATDEQDLAILRYLAGDG